MCCSVYQRRCQAVGPSCSSLCLHRKPWWEESATRRDQVSGAGRGRRASLCTSDRDRLGIPEVTFVDRHERLNESWRDQSGVVSHAGQSAYEPVQTGIGFHNNTTDWDMRQHPEQSLANWASHGTADTSGANIEPSGSAHEQPAMFSRVQG
jgi:hypothetical protein